MGGKKVGGKEEEKQHEGANIYHNNCPIMRAFEIDIEGEGEREVLIFSPSHGMVWGNGGFIKIAFFFFFFSLG